MPHTENWPVAKFHFRVDLGGTEVSFQEVSGLEMHTEVLEYRHGDSPDFTLIKQAGLVKTANLSLKKGIFKDDSHLVDLFNKMFDKEYQSERGERFDVVIELLDEQGETVMSWNVQNAFPVKYTGTDLKSSENALAVESLELAYDNITVEVA
ncbi:MAG: phage tail protein [Saprospiraceae bacterium]|nr:phage tail protein [Saprospiraceae bacterium]